MTLAHYFNFEQNRSNYALYDLSGSHVVPVLSKEVIESWQQVELFQGGKMEQVSLRHFTLYHRIQDENQLHSLSEAEKYSKKNQKGNQPIQLVSVVSWPNSAAMGENSIGI